ncbi:MAG: ATP-binding protein [Pseudomonadota bacterium]
MPPLPSETVPAPSDRPNGEIGPAEAAQKALSDGRTFAAYDIASTGLDSAANPDELRLLAAMALVRSGAVDAAREQIERASIASKAIDPASARSREGILLAELMEEIWQASGQPADLDQALAVRLRKAEVGGHFVDMAHAALLTLAQGETADAWDLAKKALDRAAEEPDKTPNRLLDLAALSLIVGEEETAKGYLTRLAAGLSDKTLTRAPRRQLESLKSQGVAVDQNLIELFPPPTLVVYAGVRLRQEDSGGFPPALRLSLSKSIDGAIEKLKPTIAYGSASAGSDLLFCESLLKHGAELNVILPFQQGSFRERLVEPYGDDWCARFDRVIEAASSVTEVCQEPYVGGDAILGFGNLVIDGTARLRGAALSSSPYLMAVWNYLAEPSPGSPSDFIDHWGDPARLRLIGLDEIANEAGVELDSLPHAQPSPERQSDGEGKQRVASLLFADVVGFSLLKDDQLPRFWRFMKAVAFHLGVDIPTPRMIDSWGDAILTVHDTALASAGYAVQLGTAFNAIDSRDFGLPNRLRLRIGLHAGPIYEGEHPITGVPVIYGGNVNRAARIEPITVPGLVYASEQFVAALTAEESELEAAIELGGGTYRPRFHCIYRGIAELPKGYGTQAVYEVEPWRERATGAVAIEPGKRLTVTLANELSEHRRLATLFRQLVEPVKVPEDVPDLFELAFDEIITNICSYAWNDEARHVIDVEITVGDNAIRANFSDDGVAFDPLDAAPAAVDDDIDERVAGGLGVHLVNEMMDEVHYRRVENANRLTIVKKWQEHGN